jgi:hypothetical protein
VPDGAPHLTQIASALGALLSRPGHEVTHAAAGRADFEDRRRSGRYHLMLDFVRKLGSDTSSTLLALLSAADPLMARKPPRLSSTSPRDIARTLPLGVVGSLKVSGSQIGELQALSSWQLGAVWWKQS